LGTVRVIAGDFQGTPGAAQTFTPINLWDVQISGTGDLELHLPDGHTALIVVQSGAVRLNGKSVKAVELAELERAETLLQLASEAPSRLLVLTGQPIGEPVVGQGPFVMNSREEIRQAIDDYQHGRMGQLTPFSG
jgi:redox-sensitive bicupin YhaK (pirin superfamily)